MTQWEEMGELFIEEEDIGEPCTLEDEVEELYATCDPIGEEPPPKVELKPLPPNLRLKRKAAGSSCKAGKVEMVTSRLPSSDQATAVVKKVFPSLCSVQVNVQNTEPGTNTENHRQHPPPFLVEEQTMNVNVDVDGAGSASSHDVPVYITDSKHLVNGQLARRMLDLVILAELVRHLTIDMVLHTKLPPSLAFTHLLHAQPPLPNEASNRRCLSHNISFSSLLIIVTSTGD
nr:hypothetical protein Iba_chr14cCG6260 [Ipomoea batatas]